MNRTFNELVGVKVVLEKKTVLLIFVFLFYLSDFGVIENFFFFSLFFSSRSLWAGNFPSPSPQPIKFLMTRKMNEKVDLSKLPSSFPVNS